MAIGRASGAVFRIIFAENKLFLPVPRAYDFASGGHQE